MEYRIETLEDFRKVPAERRAACLREFEVALRMSDEVIAEHPELEVVDGAFTWIDDGKFNAEVSINGVTVLKQEAL